METESSYQSSRSVFNLKMEKGPTESEVSNSYSSMLNVTIRLPKLSEQPVLHVGVSKTIKVQRTGKAWRCISGIWTDSLN